MKKISCILGSVVRWSLLLLIIVLPAASLYLIDWSSSEYSAFIETSLGGGLWFLWVMVTLFIFSPASALVMIGIMIAGDGADGGPVGP